MSPCGTLYGSQWVPMGLSMGHSGSLRVSLWGAAGRYGAALTLVLSMWGRTQPWGARSRMWLWGSGGRAGGNAEEIRCSTAPDSAPQRLRSASRNPEMA